MTTPVAIPTGPFLLVACFCENVVERADHVLTLVNIVDRVTITVRGPQAPELMPPSHWRAYMAVILKAGRARTRLDLTLSPERPDGTAMQSVTTSLNFEGEDDRGVQLVAPLDIGLEQEGLYWFNLRLGGQLLTRLPLRVLYTRVTMSGGQEGPG